MSGSAITDSPVAPPDPGPLARFEDVKADELAPGVVFQRLCEGETLRQIAKAWGLPRGEFSRWFLTEHGGLFDDAWKVRAQERAEEVIDVADGSTPEDVSVARLRVDARRWYASKGDRKRYGEEADAVKVTPVTIQIANLRGETKVQVGAEQPMALPDGTI